MKKSNLWLLVCFSFLLNGVQAESPPSSPGILAFADHLFAEGEYYRAVTEYQRFLFLDEDAPRASYALWQIALSYQAGEQFVDARRVAKRVQRRYSNSEEALYAPILVAATYRGEQKNHLAARELDTFASQNRKTPEGQQAFVLAGLQYLWSGDDEAAKEVLAETSASESSSAQAEIMKEEINALDHLPQKNPLLAGSLSAVLPGAGQFYVGNKSDGLIAFVLNGVLLYATYSAFENDEYVTGGLLAVIESGWYFGNIYNAMNGANHFNRRQRESFLKHLELQVAPVPGTGSPSMGIQAIFNF